MDIVKVFESVEFFGKNSISNNKVIGEEYVKNEDNDYIHYDCIEGDKWLVNWLGFEVKEMEENDD